VAAGKGKRMGKNIPKQFLLLKQRPVLWYTLQTFQLSGVIDEILLVINPDWEKESKNIAKAFSKVKYTVFGGETRQDSVWAGLKIIEHTDVVLVHDGVRPFVSENLIKRVIEGVYKWEAVVPVFPIKETVKWVEEEVIKKTIPRDHLYFAQTPQGFKHHILKEAYIRAQARKRRFTDDASLLEKTGMKVYVVLGESHNIKITTPEDLKWAETIITCG
jgi:2-C-methyl-D-erythritol 4-phosphate cytidylyltransferase